MSAHPKESDAHGPLEDWMFLCPGGGVQDRYQC